MLVLNPRIDLTTDGSPVTGLAARAVAAYLGLAVGDALGATVEFMNPSEIRERHRVHRDIVGGGWLRLRRGQVTDDTAMSLTLGRTLLAEGRVVPRAVAEAFSAWMQTKPVDIDHTVRRGIARYRQSGEVEVPPNAYDAGNGACMRCLPVALATLGAGIEQVAAANRAKSHVTHHSPLGDAGTLTVIRMVQTALTGGTLTDLQAQAAALVAAAPEYRYDRGRVENPGGYLPETLSAVFQALFAAEGFETAMIDVVNRGGDADTTGAILGMIAGAHWGLSGIPVRWLDALDPEVSRQCSEQAQRLIGLSLRRPKL
jgi:ADP-ribosyl-[dinitrogen reductase] hydrolase